MAGRTKRVWTDGEKRSICLQTAPADVSVARGAQRHAVNFNRVFKWLRDAPEPLAVPNAARFLAVDIVDHALHDGTTAVDPALAAGLIEIALAGGHRLRVRGTGDPEALVRLIRRLSG